MLAAGGGRPGEVFAREADLEKKLGVSRSILREAVNRLRAVGLLDSRQGVGLIIGKPDPVALFGQAFDSGLMDAVDLADLAELRYTLEVGAVELVVRRATPGQLAKLEELAAEFSAVQRGEGGGRCVDDIELDFHRTYLEASHSPMLTRMHHVVASFFRRAAREMPGWDPASDRSTAWDHRAIARGLRERNVERARAVLAGHLEGLLRAGAPPHPPTANDAQKENGEHDGTH